MPKSFVYYESVKWKQFWEDDSNIKHLLSTYLSALKGQDFKGVEGMCVSFQEYELCEEWGCLYPIPREHLINLHQKHLLHLLERGDHEKALQVSFQLFPVFSGEGCEGWSNRMALFLLDPIQSTHSLRSAPALAGYSHPPCKCQLYIRCQVGSWAQDPADLWSCQSHHLWS